MESILDRITTHPSHAVALSAPDKQHLTYGELSNLIQQTGGDLRILGMSAADRVAVVLPNGPTMAAAFVAIAPWCSIAPLNPAYTKEELAFYLQDLEANLLIADKSAMNAIEVAQNLGIKVVEIEESNTAGVFSLTGTGRSASPRDLDEISLILHTSGTTSRPKMVPLTERNLVSSATNIAKTLHLSTSDRCLNVMPLFHIHGLMAPILATLYSGGSVYCTPGFDVLRFFTWLEAAQPSWYSAVPTMHQAIVARAPRNADIVNRSNLRFVRSSSASLPPQVLQSVEETFKCPLVEAYAMTEAAHQVCSNPLPPEQRKPGTVGPRAGPDVALAHLSGFPEFLRPGREGQVVIRGPNVTPGYLNNPDANQRSFINRWFLTGDLGIFDEDGYLKITGRLKELINRGGEKIAPLEVDEVLLDHPSIGQVCTFGMPHPKLGEEVAAVVVLNEDCEEDVGDIRSYARTRLAEFKVPRTILFRSEIPKGPTGKVQRIGMAERLGIID